MAKSRDLDRPLCLIIHCRMAAAGTDDFIEWRRYIITRRIVTAGALVGALAAHILVGRWRARRQSGTKSRKQDKRTHAASKSAAAPARVAGKGGKGGGAAPGNNKKDKKRKAGAYAALDHRETRHEYTHTL